jgi:hypothetical protein
MMGKILKIFRKNKETGDTLVESQLQQLKFREQASTTSVWKQYFESGAIANYCLDSSATQQNDASGNIDPKWKPVPNGNQPEDLSIKTVSSGNYDPLCGFPLSNPKYFINITTDKSKPAAGPTYLIRIRWVPVGGGPSNQAQLYYRF